jgi:POPLD (NUC188) domain
VFKATDTVGLLRNFVFAGVHVVGIQEREKLFLWSEIPCFPRDFPDTTAAVKYWEDDTLEMTALMNMKPFSKRLPIDGMHWDTDTVVVRSSRYSSPFMLRSSEDYFPSVQLPFHTSLVGMLRPTGRGIPVARARILSCLSSDFLVDKDTDVISSSDDERCLLGYVTSGGEGQSGGCGIGLVSFEALRMAISITDEISQISSIPPGMVMLHNPRSRVLRPALLKVIYGL